LLYDPSGAIPRAKHGDISPLQFVIPGLTWNPVFSCPAFGGTAFAAMTPFAAINVAVYKVLYELNFGIGLSAG